MALQDNSPLRNLVSFNNVASLFENPSFLAVQVGKNKKDRAVCFHLDLKVVYVTLTNILCPKLVT